MSWLRFLGKGLQVQVGCLLTIMTTVFSEQTLAQCVPSDNPPAKQYDSVPTKIIRIYNNTDAVIYPLIETSTNSVDEWLQAYFGLCESSVFQHTLNYRIYVNGLSGISPNGYVALQVPVYTKLTDEADPALGPDKYINWWNGGRIKIYNSLITYQDDYNRDQQNRINPASVGVTCANEPKSECNDLVIYSGLGALKDDTPSQLTEYTFAGAPLQEGGNGLRLWALQDVDWDVSYVDSVYLPIAMGVLGNKYIGYTGTVLTLKQFKAYINKFLAASEVGFGWSNYIIPGNDNSIIKLPGTYNYMLGVLNKTVTPLKKNSPLANIALLWKSCFQEGSPNPNYYDFPFLKGQTLISCDDPLKSDIWKVHQLFMQNYKQYQNDPTCDSAQFLADLKAQKVPFNRVLLARIYGWVPFNDYCQKGAAANSLCKTSTDTQDPALSNPDPTVCTAQYQDAHQTYRDLQYAYTQTKYNVDNAHNFNPYVELIHGKNFLNMDAYAFSIDDAVGNMQEAGDGLVVAVGGVKGLVNRNPYNPKLAVTVTMGKPQDGRPTWKAFDACNVNAAVCIPQTPIPAGGTSFKLGSIKKFPIKVAIKDSADRIYQFIIQSGPTPQNNYTIPVDAILKDSCKVTDSNNNPVDGWCVPFTNKVDHGTPYAHTQMDENGRPVNYVSTNDPPPL
ncbi:Uncharacterised protein [Legionella beliardensis]|uniref:Thaumatin domain-containing protein n=1 Tax=Legionella beliardensis TaxID=91822 RepID=A0A378I510_9GAMM|nr:hypothetical protein [Legionella beliardensis]STX29932.1 Uncharacterised protein [Legionella beliardensis]